uniref:Uncharacterized protein n=2 Tax=PACMAD clade TaxID=147370 RepID=K4ANA5_SETIT
MRGKADHKYLSQAAPTESGSRSPSAATTRSQLTCILWLPEWKALVTLKRMAVVSCRRSGTRPARTAAEKVGHEASVVSGPRTSRRPVMEVVVLLGWYQPAAKAGPEATSAS